eukprot:280548-Rhodomonas_salina.2
MSSAEVRERKAVGCERACIGWGSFTASAVRPSGALNAALARQPEHDLAAGALLSWRRLAG